MDLSSQCIVDHRSSAGLRWRMPDERKPRKKAVTHSEPAKQALGQSLASARKEAGFTMDAAAKALGLSGKGAIDNFEKGRNVIDGIQLRQLARFYKISVDELVGHDHPQERWPFSDELRHKVLALSAPEIVGLENVMLSVLDMAAISSSFLTGQPIGSGASRPLPYPAEPEAGEGVMQESELPEPKKHGSRSKTDRGQKRGQGGRGT